MSRKYAHGEAFCLMKYRAKDGEEEIIWNSRDGVTPFCITLRSGKEATHVDWNEDRCAPDHKPKANDRIFVDMTPERAKELALATARRYFDEYRGDSEMDPRQYYKSPEEMAAYLASEVRAGSPDLIEVSE